MENRPTGREKNITGTGKDVYKRGTGLGTGPVGGSSPAGRPAPGKKNSLLALISSLLRGNKNG